MKNIRRLTVSFLTLLIAFTFVPAAFAHPLGNFTINQYVGLKINPETILVDYVVDMAEIPAFQELAPFDSDRDRQPDLPALKQYPADKCASVLPDLDLRLAGRSVPLAQTASSLEMPIGVGGLPTIRLTCEYRSMIDPVQGTLNLTFMNNAFPDRIGWKELVVFAEGVGVEGEFATTSLSSRLTNYPQDLLTSPLDVRQVEVELVPLGLPAQPESDSSAPQSNATVTDRNDAFTRLILLEDVTLPVLLLALGISFVWGAAHAMTPGHGKTIVGAYLVGSRGTIKHAVYLGLTTTITHTLGVFALGLVTLFAAQYIVPEKLYPWMSLLSGVFVLGIGLNLFIGRFKSSGLVDRLGKFKFRRMRVQPAVTGFSTKAGGMGQVHRFVLASSHGHGPDDHHHGHEDHHFHEHGNDHHQDHVHPHSYDHADHSHTPPETITGRSLLALGVSGGLIPCPSALVVMLGAIALNRIGFGLVLVLAFSLGLAGALTAIGMLFIYAGRLFKKYPSSGMVISFLPVLSALFISLIGLGIVYRALAEFGVV